MDRIPREDRPGFRSYAAATWRDLDNKEHRRFVVRRMKEGTGFEVIDTYDANSVESSNFTTMESAQEWMNKNLAP
jgi:hypothetical protein